MIRAKGYQVEGVSACPRCGCKGIGIQQDLYGFYHPKCPGCGLSTPSGVGLINDASVVFDVNKHAKITTAIYTKWNEYVSTFTKNMQEVKIIFDEEGRENNDDYAHGDHI